MVIKIYISQIQQPSSQRILLRLYQLTGILMQVSAKFNKMYNKQLYRYKHEKVDAG
jgi:hypothetical protein